MTCSTPGNVYMRWAHNERNPKFVPVLVRAVTSMSHTSGTPPSAIRRFNKHKNWHINCVCVLRDLERVGGRNRRGCVGARTDVIASQGRREREMCSSDINGSAARKLDA